ncbi:MAG: alpha/beta fold hydrolase [Marinagarivorans sp.]|nr:alpha/beta fold hydrolase [Marinagarivorans sp.]
MKKINLWLLAGCTSLGANAAEVRFNACDHSLNGTDFYGAECAALAVNTQQSEHITTLNVLRVRALSGAAADPLIVITGGPGTAAVSLARQYLGFFTEVQKTRDIVFIDQRGTGKSEPFNCPQTSALDSTQAAEQLIAQTQAALKYCAHTQANLNTISTSQAAWDIEQVRQALGYAQLNLWGSSYGTRVAQEYQRLFPATSRTVIIDGVAPAIIALPHYAEQDAGHALGALFSACAAQPACHTAFGDLPQRWQQLMLDLQKNPPTQALQHPRTQVINTMEISAALVANWVRFALYNRELSALLPLAITQASQGDFQPLANLAQTASDSVQDSMSQGMHAAILCGEDSHAPSLLHPKSGHEVVMPFASLNDLRPVCNEMPAPLLPPEPLFEPIKSAVPSLVLSGQFDPVTPAFWGDWASQQLSNSQHWVVEGGHHGVSGLGCMPKLLADFIARASFNGLNTDCLKTLKATAFFVDNAGPALSQPIAENQLEAQNSPGLISSPTQDAP